MVSTVLTVIEIVTSVLLIGAILLQAKGTGLDSSFGGEGEFYRSKRGIERTLLYATIALIVVFGATSVALLIVT